MPGKNSGLLSRTVLEESQLEEDTSRESRDTRHEGYSRLATRVSVR